MKNRNSNIELLRIVSIIMIVVGHYCYHGVGIDVVSKMPLGINRFLLEILNIGNLGSVLFVIISGYFLIQSKKVKLKKICQIVFQVFFYSFFIYLILVIANLEHFSFKNVLLSTFPFTFKLYWFSSAYLILYIFHPYINLLLNSFTRKQNFTFIFIMFLIFSFLSFLTTSDYYGNELIQFLLFYAIGAYLYKYPKNIFNLHNNNIKFLLLSIAMIVVSIISIDLLSNYLPIVTKHSTYFLKRTSPLVIIIDVCLFNIFNNFSFGNSKCINKIASLVFGVYLISDNRFLRIIIWNNLFKNLNYIKSPFLFIHILGSILLIVIICLIIELFRKYLFDKLIFEKFNSKFDILETSIKKHMNSGYHYFIKN